MSTSISLTKNVFRVVQMRLGVLGFEKRKPGIFTTKISDDVIGWVGLNTATRSQKNVLEVNTVVGVRNQGVESLVAELAGDAFDEVIPPTVAGNIGYLTPTNRYLPFVFSGAPTDEGVADELCQAVTTYGLPFMKKVANLAALVEVMQTQRFGMAEQLNYRIPTALLLMAENLKAKAFVDAKVREIGARTDPAATRYKNFAVRLSERST